MQQTQKTAELRTATVLLCISPKQLNSFFFWCPLGNFSKAANSYYGHRVILPAARSSEAAPVLLSHPAPRHTGTTGTTADAPRQTGTRVRMSSPVGVQQVAHGWCCLNIHPCILNCIWLICLSLQPVRFFICPDLRPPVLWKAYKIGRSQHQGSWNYERRVDAEGTRLYAAIHCTFYCSLNVLSQQGKAACKLLAVVELEDISEKMET